MVCARPTQWRDERPSSALENAGSSKLGCPLSTRRRTTAPGLYLSLAQSNKIGKDHEGPMQLSALLTYHGMLALHGTHSCRANTDERNARLPNSNHVPAFGQQMSLSLLVSLAHDQLGEACEFIVQALGFRRYTLGRDHGWRGLWPSLSIGNG